MHNSTGGPDFDGHDQMNFGNRYDGNVMESAQVEPSFRFADKRGVRRLYRRLLKTSQKMARLDRIFPPQNTQIHMELTPTPSVPYNKMNEVPEDFQEMARQIILQQFVRPMEDDMPTLELHDFHFFWEDGRDKYGRQLLRVQFNVM